MTTCSMHWFILASLFIVTLAERQSTWHKEFEEVFSTWKKQRAEIYIEVEDIAETRHTSHKKNNMWVAAGTCLVIAGKVLQTAPSFLPLNGINMYGINLGDLVHDVGLFANVGGEMARMSMLYWLAWKDHKAFKDVQRILDKHVRTHEKLRLLLAKVDFNIPKMEFEMKYIDKMKRYFDAASKVFWKLKSLRMLSYFKGEGNGNELITLKEALQETGSLYKSWQIMNGEKVPDAVLQIRSIIKTLRRDEDILERSLSKVRQ